MGIRLDEPSVSPRRTTNSRPVAAHTRRYCGFAVPTIPIGFQAHYATVLVTVYQDAGSWIITVADPFGAGTASRVSGSINAAKQQALVVAQWYLRNTYPDFSWPVIPDKQIRWKKIPRRTN